MKEYSSSRRDPFFKLLRFAGIIIFVCVLALIALHYFQPQVVTGSPRYDDAELYLSGGFVCSADDIDEIVLAWTNGSVTVSRAADGQISASEENDAKLSEEQKLRWRVDGRALLIQFCESELSAVFPADKNLSLTVPDGIALRVDSIAADVTMKQLTLDRLDIASTSGSALIGSLSAGEASLRSVGGRISAESLTLQRGLTVKTTSGNIQIKRLSAEKADMTSTSGSLTIGLTACRQGSFTSTGGNITLSLLDGLGAAADCGTTSGKINGQSVREAHLSFGDGACALSLRSTSGQITVK